MPTQVTGAIRPVQQRARVTRPMLPLDDLGRPYLEIVDKEHRETSELVIQAVEEYYRRAGSYPAVVYMNAFRYFTFGMKARYYMPIPGIKIPLSYEGNSEYSVLCRGEIPDAWVR